MTAHFGVEYNTKRWLYFAKTVLWRVANGLIPFCLTRRFVIFAFDDFRHFYFVKFDYTTRYVALLLYFEIWRLFFFFWKLLIQRNSLISNFLVWRSFGFYDIFCSGGKDVKSVPCYWTGNFWVHLAFEYAWVCLNAFNLLLFVSGAIFTSTPLNTIISCVIDLSSGSSSKQFYLQGFNSDFHILSFGFALIDRLLNSKGLQQ